MKTYIVETKEIVYRTYAVRAENEDNAKLDVLLGDILNETIVNVDTDCEILSVKENAQ